MDTNTQVALAAFGVGAAFGAVARWSGFCLRGAVEDVLTKPEAPRARGFVLAIVVGLVAVQVLVFAGKLDLSKAVVLPTSLFWGGALLGGLMFGVGMVLTGGCGTRMLVLAGGGNLRSVVVFVVFGFVAYATIRGILAPARAAMMAASSINLAKQTLPLAVGGVVLLAALVFVLWRRVPAKHLVGGALIGLLVPLGYLVTGVLGRRRVRAHDRAEHQRHAGRRRRAGLSADLDRRQDQFRHRLRGWHPGRRCFGRAAGP